MNNPFEQDRDKLLSEWANGVAGVFDSVPDDWPVGPDARFIRPAATSRSWMNRKVGDLVHVAGAFFSHETDETAVVEFLVTYRGPEDVDFVYEGVSLSHMPPIETFFHDKLERVLDFYRLREGDIKLLAHRSGVCWLETP